MPGVPGYKFDGTCGEVLASTCPCDFSIGALAALGLDESNAYACEDGVRIDARQGNIRTDVDLRGGCDFYDCDIDIVANERTDLAGVILDARCYVQTRHSEIILGPHMGLTATQFNDCAKDLRTAADLLGLTCSH